MVSSDFYPVKFLILTKLNKLLFVKTFFLFIKFIFYFIFFYITLSKLLLFVINLFKSKPVQLSEGQQWHQ